MKTPEKILHQIKSFTLPILVLYQAVFCTEVSQKNIEIEDYFSQSWISSSLISPDGKYVAYLERRWNKEKDKRDTDLWVVSVKNKDPYRLTFDGKYKEQVQWSPDSDFIYYKASHNRSKEEHPPYNGTSQVWKISLTGSIAVPITQVKKGIGFFQLSKNGRSIYYTTKKKSVSNDCVSF